MSKVLINLASLPKHLYPPTMLYSAHSEYKHFSPDTSQLFKLTPCVEVKSLSKNRHSIVDAYMHLIPS